MLLFLRKLLLQLLLLTIFCFLRAAFAASFEAAYA